MTIASTSGSSMTACASSATRSNGQILRAASTASGEKSVTATGRTSPSSASNRNAYACPCPIIPAPISPTRTGSDCMPTFSPARRIPAGRVAVYRFVPTGSYARSRPGGAADAK